MNKHFDHVTAKALEQLSKEGLVKKFLSANQIVVLPEAFIPVEQAHIMFGDFTEETVGIIYAREFFEMIFLSSLENISVAEIEINGRDVECFVGIGNRYRELPEYYAPAAMRAMDEAHAFSEWKTPAVSDEDLSDQFADEEDPDFWVPAEVA
jgi:hypothetical protein